MKANGAACRNVGKDWKFPTWSRSYDLKLVTFATFLNFSWNEKSFINSHRDSQNTFSGKHFLLKNCAIFEMVIKIVTKPNKSDRV